MIGHRRGRAGVALAAVLALAAFPAVATSTPAGAEPTDPKPGQPAEPSRTEGVATYRNAVSDSFSDTFADPAVIQAKDGWWYAYSTADPLHSGDAPGVMHIARTKDWAEWEYLGTVFDEDNRPAFAEPTAGLWAPDVRYLDGRYVLYYSVTDTTLHDGDGDSAIGMATAPTPTGPWQPVDTPVVAPRPDSGPEGDAWETTIDPAHFTATDGTRYLYWGSYGSGLWVSELTEDGTSTVGEPTMVATDNRYEGSFVVRHDDWYYLMGSAANCCAGPSTGYSVLVGRSASPLGPFVDAAGDALTDPWVGGELVLTQNGNRFIGAGHHAVATDATGQDFIVYHALDRHEPWLTDPLGINRRPMLIDRLDWIDGWPVANAGAGPSDEERPGPVVGSDLGITAEDPAAGGVPGLVAGPDDPQSGATARLAGFATTTAAAPADRVHLSLDFRTDRRFQVTLGDLPDTTTVDVDPMAGELRVVTRVGRDSSTETAPLEESAHWRRLRVDVAGSGVTAAVSESGLSDDQAEVRGGHDDFRLAAAPVHLSGFGQLDNLTVRAGAEPVTERVSEPIAGRELSGDEFTRSLEDGWEWVREDPHVQVFRGQLSWPLAATDLAGEQNTGGVLLADTPDGDWIAETKLHLDLGDDEVRNFQQAGLIAYVDDDDFARLGQVAIWNTRQTEYARERAVAPGDDRTSYGGSVVGTAGDTVWLRLAHRVAENGEHHYRAGTSKDGKDWTWGAVWTFAAEDDPRLGLYAGGGATPRTVASFDYLRFHEVSW